jgi:hypothetical protein
MQQRDLLKDEIERLGGAIGKAIARLLNTTSGNQPGAGWEQVVNDELWEALGLPLETLLTAEREELLQLMVEQKMTPVHIEQLADFLQEAAGREDRPEQQILLLERALLLYDLAAAESGDYSFSRVEKEQKVQQQLSGLRRS